MGNANATFTVIGVALLVFGLAMLTELANWYVRSDIPIYSIALFISLIFLSGITQNKYKKVSNYLGTASAVLLIVHLLLSISAH